MLTLLRDIEKELNLYEGKKYDMPMPLITEVNLDLKDVHFYRCILTRNTKNRHHYINLLSNLTLLISSSPQCNRSFAPSSNRLKPTASSSTRVFLNLYFEVD